MALTFDTKLRIPTSASTTMTTAPTANYTCGSSAGALVVFVYWAGTTARTGGNPTYAGSALTEVFTQKTVTETSMETWYMLSPPSGVALELLIPNSGGRTMWVHAASGNSTSASISYAYDSSGSNATTAANPNVSLTTVAAPTIIFAGVGTGDNTWLPTARTGTHVYDDDIGTYGSGTMYYIKTDTGAQTLTWSDATNDDYESIAVAFKEATRNFPIHTVNNATHIQTSDNITLTPHAPNFTLTVQGATQLQNADNIVVTYHVPSFQATANNAQHIHASDNVVLTQHHVLTVGNTQHLQTADNIALFQNYVLTLVNSVVQGQLCDNIILTQNYALIVNIAIQIQISDSISLGGGAAIPIKMMHYIRLRSGK